MPVLDPSGFQIAVKIVTPERQTFPLWWTPTGAAESAESGATVDAALGADGDQLLSGLPCIESVNIEIALGMNSKLTVSIGTGFDIGLAVLRSALLRIGNVVECQVGYPRISRFMPWISAMAARPEVQINPDEGLTATINGEGGAFIALRGSRSAEYTNLSYVDIIRQILTNDGYRNVQLEVPDTNGADDPLYVTRERMSQSNQSDWFFIQYITRSANCDAWMEPSRDREGQQVLKVVRRTEVLGTTPRFVFVMRGRPDFDVYFPILSFETQGEGVWLPGAATSVRTGGINPDTLETLDLVASREDSTVPATGDAAVSGDAGATVEDTDVRLAHPTEGDTAGDHLYVSERDPRGQLVVAEVHQTESAIRGGGVQVSITSIGIPDLFPGEIVGIQGMGMFDSLYLVQKVTHSVSAEEWSMTLDLVNNATSSAMLAALLSFTPTVVNEATPPEPSGDATGGGIEVEAVPEGS